MSERSNLISKLKSNFKTRAAYIEAKISTLVPSQIRALRLKSATPRQPDLAHAADMKQSRISVLETPGANPTLATLSAIAAALKVGLKVEFVPFSEMLAWENSFSQDRFEVTPLDNDLAFINPSIAQPPVVTRGPAAWYSCLINLQGTGQAFGGLFVGEATPNYVGATVDLRLGSFHESRGQIRSSNASLSTPRIPVELLAVQKQENEINART